MLPAGEQQAHTHYPPPVLTARLPRRPLNPALPAPDVSRQKDVFLLAANYLQSAGEWRTSHDALRTMVGFYAKAGAHGSLAAFYEARAQAEIEGAGHDYSRALQVRPASEGAGVGRGFCYGRFKARLTPDYHWALRAVQAQ